MNGDRDIRDLLRAKANEIPPSTGIPSTVLARSRRRRALTASVVSVALVIVGAGALAGVRAMTDRPGLDPIRPAPMETDLQDRSSIEQVMRTDFGTMRMVSVANGRLPNGDPYVLRVGESRSGYCAELLPDGTSVCARGSLLPSDGVITLYSQGASSDNFHQHFFGATVGSVTDVEVRSKGEVVDAVRTQPVPVTSELETRAHFFVAFAPQRAAGTILALDGAGRPSSRLSYKPLHVSDGCGAGTSAPDSRSGLGLQGWPLPGMGPVELFATSLTALWSAGGVECESSSARVGASRRVEGSKP